MGLTVHSSELLHKITASMSSTATTFLVLVIANMNILGSLLVVLTQLFLKNIFCEVVKCLLYVDVGFGACFQEADAMLSGDLWQKEE